MKANDYVERFNKAETYDAFGDVLVKTLKELVEDTQHLIKIRHAKSDSAICACINEVDTKWRAIVRKFNDGEPKGYELEDGWKTVILVNDGFKAAFVQFYPKYSWAFDLKKHAASMERRQKIMDGKRAAQEEALKNFAPYPVKQYSELTMENLAGEILARTQALGMYYSVGLPIPSISPLAQSIHLLRYWLNRGAIDLADVEEYEKDPAAWIRQHM